jgi:hypothetical protein
MSWREWWNRIRGRHADGTRHQWPPYPDRWWLYECFTLTCRICGHRRQIDEPVQRMY